MFRLLKAALARLAPHLRRKVLAALAARRVPAPLRAVVRGLLDPEQRDFWFWWLAATLALGLVLGLLLAAALAPVTLLLGLIGLGIWALVHKVRARPSAS